MNISFLSVVILFINFVSIEANSIFNRLHASGRTICQDKPYDGAHVAIYALFNTGNYQLLIDGYSNSNGSFDIWAVDAMTLGDLPYVVKFTHKCESSSGDLSFQIDYPNALVESGEEFKMGDVLLASPIR
ncbi:unnamed protein product, partial [Mesorhabditis belari]|uniref:Uncharacterized protein n=1 Tax=Mesorhabditis belari TaxID=2138241 RepID=A0AAF3FJ80_9BILA